MQSTTPIMCQHDPDDDPFAALTADYDAEHKLVSPLEFGSGAIAKMGEDSTEATVEDDERSLEDESPTKESKDAPETNITKEAKQDEDAQKE
jgi:hypothetical protein